jgi:hypothetical protein
MRHCCKLPAASTVRCWLLQGIARLVFLAAFPALVASMTTEADDQQHSVVAGVDAKSAALTPGEVHVRVGNITVPATAIRATPEIPRNVAIVMDAGPDQSTVLSKEKELAVALINELSNSGTSFTIASAGALPKVQAPTPERSIAIGHIRDITADTGRKTNIPIYDAIGLTIQKVSATPGLRIVIFIGEGNDGASKLRYAELRNLAESNQIAFLAALVADHSLRGTKSILRYGWNLQELTSDTAGIFLENQKTPKAARRLTENIQSLRLIALDMPSRQPGRHKISVSTRQGKRLRAQKNMVVP